MTTETTIQGDVAIIAMNNPPVNGLGYETRVGITNALEKANADPAIKAIVLTGAGKAFSGGADIREFNSAKAMQEPILLSVILAVEHSQKPVVAAVHSVAMGGGAQVARASADFILINDNLPALLQAIDLAHRARRTVFTNMAWAVGYNLTALPLAAAGWVAPWMAAIGMSLSSLLVVLNSRRLGARVASSSKQTRGGEPAWR